MKFINKDKKALTLIEVMVFFIVASVLLMLTLPAMTQKKSNNVCIPGGYVIFDGSKVVKGDTKGVVKVNCTTRQVDGAEICEYVWRAPTNEVYITSVGGGGGGSGAMRFSENEGFFCEHIIAKYLSDYCKQNPTQSDGVTPTDGCDGAGHVDYVNYPDVMTNPDGTVSFIAWKNPQSPITWDGAQYRCVSELLTTDEDQNKSLLCSVDPSNNYKPIPGGDAFGLGIQIDSTTGRVLNRYDAPDPTRSAIINNLKELYPNKSNSASIAENIYNNLVSDASDTYIDPATGKCNKETIPKDTKVNRLRLCSMDDNGEPDIEGVANCKPLPTGADPIYPTPDYRILNGAGGSGGNYTFGANFDPSFVSDKTLIDPERQRRAYEEYVANIAKPILLKRGDLYRIKVGQGGVGGKTLDPRFGEAKYYGEFDPDHFQILPNGEKVKDFINAIDPITNLRRNLNRTIDGYDGISGKTGDASCVIVNESANRCNCGSMLDANCTNRVFAVAGGGQGAFGTYDNFYDKGYYISIQNKDNNTISTYFTAPWAGNYTKGPRFTANQIHNLNLTPPDSFMQQDISNTAAVRPDDCNNTPIGPNCQKYDALLGRLSGWGYPPQALGLPGSVLAPGKGGPSLYGIDRPGAGGDGGYYKWNDSRAETNKNFRNNANGIRANDRIETKGRDGLIEIRWFTTCE